MTTKDDDSKVEIAEERLHYVISADEIKNGERVVVDIKEREIGVFRIDGEFYALSNFCVHQGGPACEGQIGGTLGENEDGQLTYECDDELVSCPWHGWMFDIRTGRNTARPDRYRQPTYDVVVRDNDVYVVL